MEKKVQTNLPKDTVPASSTAESTLQHEDIALKTSMHFFAEEMLPYPGIKGKVKPITSFSEGRNTYHIVPIIMKDKDADKLFAELQDKIACGETITRQDLVPLTLCLLMEGKMPLKDRVKTAYNITKSAVSVNSEDIRKVEAVLYVMAEKFLDSMEMDEILEGLSMMELGQKLISKGALENKLAG